MVFIPQQELLPWKISITIFHLFATLTTCLRLEYRRRTHKLWWDDRAAVVPAVLQLTVNIAVLWLRVRYDPTIPVEWKVFYSYTSGVCYGTIVWWSRIALGLTVIRITPTWSRCRRFAIVMTCSFFVFWISVILAMIVTCSVHTEWQHSQSPILVCGPAHYVAMTVVILDIMGDIALIGIPFSLLWSLKHPSSQRRYVLFVFSASTLTLLSSIIFCIASYAKKFLVGPGHWVVWLMIVHMMEAVSMITSNLVVLICWFRHRFLNDQSSPDDVDHPSLPTLEGPVTQAGNLSNELQFTRASSGSSHSHSQDDQWDGSVGDGGNDAEDESVSQSSGSGSGSSTSTCQ